MLTLLNWYTACVVVGRVVNLIYHEVNESTSYHKNVCCGNLHALCTLVITFFDILYVLCACPVCIGAAFMPLKIRIPFLYDSSK